MIAASGQKHTELQCVPFATTLSYSSVLEGTHLPTNAIELLTVSKMNAITPPAWMEGVKKITGSRKNPGKMEGRKKKEKWDKMKSTRTELDGITMTKREEKSALKHPPQHPPQHRSLHLLIYIPLLSVLADQFPLDIDYCYNCTMLITCPLESLSLCFSHCLPLYFLLSWFKYLSRPFYFSHEIYINNQGL